MIFSITKLQYLNHSIAISADANIHSNPISRMEKNIYLLVNVSVCINNYFKVIGVEIRERFFFKGRSS